MITVFNITNTATCVNCRETKRLLEENDYEFVLKDYTNDFDELVELCSKHDVDVSTIKAAPVLVSDEGVFTGYDCIVAIEDGEV